MRFIKFILISGVVLFVMLTALSLLFPSRLRISRAINIYTPHFSGDSLHLPGDSLHSAPMRPAYRAVTDLSEWDRWNEFVKSTPLTGKSLSPVTSGKNAFLRSDQLLVSEVKAGPDSLVFEWAQTRGRHFTGGFNFMQLSADSLTVQWWFDFHFRWYPWEKLGILVYDKQLGPVMEESLAGLKQYIENSH